MPEPKKPSDTSTAEMAPTSRPSTVGGGIVKTPALRLVALDAVDLTIIAANLQDAVGKVRDMAFVPKDKRFAMLLNRFDWAASTLHTKAEKQLPTLERRRCALRFERVRSVKTTGFVQKDKKLVLSLLTIGFEQEREGDPAGAITLLFAGGSAIRLDAECIEAELTDIGTGWRTARQPVHPED